MFVNLPSLNLKAFYTVSQTLSFSKAALKLNVTQSALSQRVLNLESELNLTLFIRDRAGLRLTEAGTKLLRYCQVHHSLEDELLSELNFNPKEGLSGNVRIAGFSSIVRSLLIPSLAPLAQKNSNLFLSITTKELDELLGLLKSSVVDFIITNEDPDHGEIQAEFLGYEKNVLVKSSRHTLKTEIFLDHDEKDVTTTMYLKLLKRSPKSIKKRYLDDVYGLIDGVRAGYGTAVLPEHLIRGNKDFTVVDSQTHLLVPVYLVYYAQPYYTKLHQAVIKHVTDHFKSHLLQKAK